MRMVVALESVCANRVLVKEFEQQQAAELEWLLLKEMENGC